MKNSNYSTKQWKIITSDCNYKQVIAAAGSGKTRTVIGYTEYQLEHNPNNNKILLLSFSRKACGEIISRLPEKIKKNVEVRTFHSFCYKYLKKFHPEYSKNSFHIFTDKHKKDFLQGIINNKPEITYGIPYTLLINKLEKMNRYLPELYFKVQTQLKEYKIKNHFLEFNDLIEIVLNGLKKNEKWIEPLKELYNHIIVDEFQDTDPKQMEFLYLLKPQKLLIVGDDWQAIYGFRGATVKPLLNFRKFFRSSKIFKLDENYRSLENIIKVSNKVIEYSSKKICKVVKSIRGNIINLPVLGFNIEKEYNTKIIVECIKKYKGMLLVRSNYRKSFWIEQGVSTEQVMTIHKSKGLEFPLVFIDIFKGWSGESLLVDEEIRILYVAITRTKNLCIILYGDSSKKLEYFIFNKILYKNIILINQKNLQYYLDKELNFRNTMIS